jgi:hypothetical protein
MRISLVLGLCLIACAASAAPRSKGEVTTVSWAIAMEGQHSN